MDIGFSSHAVLTYYSVSKYFVLESKSAEFELRSLENQKLSIALISKEHRVGIKARVFPEAWKSRFGSLEMKTSSGQCFLKSIFKMSNTYMNKSLIY